MLAPPAGIAGVGPGIGTRPEQGPVLAVPHLEVRPEEEIIRQRIRLHIVPGQTPAPEESRTRP